MKKQRIALVGTGGRGLSFVEPIVSLYHESVDLVALCDLSAKRLAYYNDLLSARWGRSTVPTYLAPDFDRLLKEQRPDRIIICTKDSTHADYIVRSLDAGCDVITEKPMTIDESSCRRILDAVARSGRKVQVTFNYRWGAFRTKVREAIAGGAIGRVKSVNLEYLLDTSHGADYFRRWHSSLQESGGLLVHKSTHHFDLVNWWLDAIPERVFAQGDLAFYGRANAVARGDTALTAYPRYTGCESGSDPFALDLRSTESFRRLYLEAEADSGYLRDRNVFRDGIDIFDQMSAIVRYRTGELLTYSLVAYSPREGMRVTFNGDRGRLEYYEFTGSHMNRAVASDQFQHEHHGSAEAAGEWIRVYPHFQPSYELSVPASEGPHGGADRVMVEQLFSPAPPPDAWARTAGHEQGAASILVGIAANRSIATGQPVRLDQLVALRPELTRLRDLV